MKSETCQYIFFIHFNFDLTRTQPDVFLIRILGPSLFSSPVLLLGGDILSMVHSAKTSSADSLSLGLGSRSLATSWTSPLE